METKKGFDFADTMKSLLGYFLMPSKTYEKRKNNITMGSAFAFFGIVVVMFIIASVISSLLSVLSVSALARSYAFKNIAWLSITLGYGLMLSAFLLGVPAVFLVGGIAIKNKVKYERLLTITTAICVPMIVALLVSSLVSVVSSVVGTIIIGLAAIYSGTTFITLLTSEFNLEGDKKIYFFSICTVAIYVITVILAAIIAAIVTFSAVSTVSTTRTNSWSSLLR